MPKKIGWVRCRDPSLIVRLCGLWNKGRFSETLWEYGALTPSILKERKARGWLYHESNSVKGFALGRELRGWWHFEELWGPCEGSSELPTRVASRDACRAQYFREFLDHLGPRILIRAAVDNPFANIVALEIGAISSGGFLLATRRLDGKLRVRVPPGFRLRRFRRGDENDMSRIHLNAFNYPSRPSVFLKWSTSPNCRTTVAVSEQEIVGFLTAEKRRYQKLGDFNIAIDPQFHGKGLGSALVDTGLNDLLGMGCMIAVADFLLQNAKVQALNRKHGFNIVRAYNYYRIERTS